MGLQKVSPKALQKLCILCYSFLIAALSYTMAWAGGQGFTAAMMLPILLFVGLALYLFFLVFCFRSWIRALIQVVATWVAIAAGWGVHFAISGWPVHPGDVMFIASGFVIHLAAYGIVAGGLLGISYALGEWKRLSDIEGLEFLEKIRSRP